jgi:hypothetical protein
MQGRPVPDRILRAGLFTSEPWLALKGNDDRVCYLALFEHADCLGNHPAGLFLLARYWTPYGPDTPEKAAKVLLELVDVGLVSTYTAVDKPYLHILRFRQSTRFPGKLWPLHPHADDSEKQVHARKSRVTLGDPPAWGLGLGVDLKNPREEPVDKLAIVDNSASSVPTPVEISTKGKPQENSSQAHVDTRGVNWSDPTSLAALGVQVGTPPRTGELTFDYALRLRAAIARPHNRRR